MADREDKLAQFESWLRENRPGSAAEAAKRHEDRLRAEGAEQRTREIVTRLRRMVVVMRPHGGLSDPDTIERVANLIEREFTTPNPAPAGEPTTKE